MDKIKIEMEKKLLVVTIKPVRARNWKVVLGFETYSPKSY